MTRYLYKILALLIPIVALSQAPTPQGFTPNVIPPSPNAASIQKYGDIPISYYTGTATIAAPLYTFTEGGVQVPVSLNYHPSGIRVADEASQVGLGWALNAGGVVSRTIMGRDDFEDHYYFNTVNSIPQNYIPNPLVQEGLLVPNAIENCSFSFINPQGSTVNQNLYQDPAFSNEYEPDHFNFSFPGGGGKFYMTRDKKVFFENKSDIKVELIEDPNISGAETGQNISWQITTTDGTKYIFSETETYYVPSSAIPKKHVSSWYLSRIIPYTGSEVVLTYNKIPNGKNYPQGSISETKKIITIGETCTDGTQIGSGISQSEPTRAGAKYMETVYLDKVSGPNGYMQFHYSDREDLFWDKKFDKLEVFAFSTNGSQLIKEYQLNYDYFDCDFDADFLGTGEGSISKRLKLLSVDEKATDGQIIKQYEYTYYEEDNYSQMPSKTSFAIDHWGYFNGQYANTSLIPTFESYSSNDLADFYYGIMTGSERDSHPDYAKAFSLKRITYATGGYTELTYEGHDYDVLKSKENDFSIGRNRPIVEQKNKFFLYNMQAKGSQQNYLLDLTKGVTSENSNKTILRLKSFVRFSNSISCTAANTSQKVFFEIINSDTNESFGVYDLLALTPCTEGSTLPCSKRLCQEDLMQGIEHSNLLNVPVGNYSWRVFAADGSDFSVADFSINFSWFQSKTADPGSISYAGGLRLKKIIDFDGTKSIIKNFDYTTIENINGQDIKRSSGRLMTLPQYTYTDDSWCVNNGIGGTVYYNFRNIYRSSNSIVPLNASASGSIVGYDKVTVTYGENGEFGKSVFYYDNQADIVNNYGLYRTPTVASVSYIGNGNLLKQEDFKYDNGTYSLVKEIENEYYIGKQFKIPAQAPFLYGVELRPFVIRVAGEIKYVNTHGFFYPVVAEKFTYLKSSREKVYDSVNGASFTETINSTVYPTNQYNSSTNTFNKTYFLPSEVLTTNSKQDEVKTIFKYPHEIAVEPYLSMVNQNLVGSAVEEKTTIKGVQSKFKKTNFAGFGNRYLPSSIETQLGGNDPLFTEITFNTYDGLGKVTSYTERNGITTSMEYFTSLDDPGKVNLLKSSTITGGSFIQTSSYDYFPMIGVKSQTTPNGISTFYTYDTFNRLMTIKDNNGKIVKSYNYNYVGQGQ